METGESCPPSDGDPGCDFRGDLNQVMGSNNGLYCEFLTHRQIAKVLPKIGGVNSGKGPILPILFNSPGSAVFRAESP